MGKRLNIKRLFRQVHYWLSLIILVPCAIIFVTGTLLMLKKDINWIQPEVQKGDVENAIPEVTFETILLITSNVSEMEVDSWADIKRIDIRPSKGIAKIQTDSGWELQIDTNNGTPLQTAKRRSDLIESIHDGTFFSHKIKYFVFLPASFILIMMWVSGVYLFVVPLQAKLKKRGKLLNVSSGVKK